MLFEIENPELLTRLREAEAAKIVAATELAHIEAGTRAEVVAQRKAAIDSAEANLTLAKLTYDRTKQLVGEGHAPLQRLDEVTDQLAVAQRSTDQAKLAYEEALAGPTKEERGIATANVAKAQASIDTIRAQADELVVKAPVSAQVYQIGAELGEYVSPGVPLLSLIDLSDVWLRFDLREDLAKGLKTGDKLQMRVPALGDRLITAAVKVIATKGEYAGWRATRSTGDFDLRTFEVRAYPTQSHTGTSSGDECLRRVAEAAMRSAPRPGVLLVATRELRWMRRDGLALFLVIGVPVIAFTLLALIFSNAVIRNLQVSIVDADRTPTSMTYVQAIGSAPGVRVTGRSDDLKEECMPYAPDLPLQRFIFHPTLNAICWRESAPKSSRFTIANILRQAIAPQAPLRMPLTLRQPCSLLHGAPHLHQDFWPSSNMFSQIQH